MFKYLASLFALSALVLNLGLSASGCAPSGGSSSEVDGLAALRMICGVFPGDGGETDDHLDHQDRCGHCFLTNAHLAFGPSVPLVAPTFRAVLVRLPVVELSSTQAPRTQLPPRAPPV